MKSIIKILAVSIAAILGSGCANNPLSSYKATTDARLQNIYIGNYMAAMQAESTDDVLFNMEYGTLLRMNQSYESSNVYFTKAQTSVDAWVTSWANSTIGEISQTTMSMLINDNINDYQPLGYEKTFLPTLHALNNFDLNNLDNARVEIKKMTTTEDALAKYNAYMYNVAQADAAKYQGDSTQNMLYNQIMKQYNFKDINSPQVLALKNSYQNAFSNYLAGFVFEALNEPSLARPGYLRAGQLVPTNKLIQQSLDNIDKNNKVQSGYTDLLIIEEVGHAPQIKSNQMNLLIPAVQIGNDNNSCPVSINIFYPSLVIDKKNKDIYQFSIDNNVFTPETMADTNLMAARAILDDIPRITARNIAAAVRNIATTQASCAAGGGVGSLLNLAANIGGILLDNADERNWNLLPSKVNVSRSKLAYGNHVISINVNGVNYTKSIKLDKPYQIISYRIVGNQVVFTPQRGMVN